MLVKHMPLLHDIGCQDVRKGFQHLYKYNSSQLSSQHTKYLRFELYQCYHDQNHCLLIYMNKHCTRN